MFALARANWWEMGRRLFNYDAAWKRVLIIGGIGYSLLLVGNCFSRAARFPARMGLPGEGVGMNAHVWRKVGE